MRTTFTHARFAASLLVSLGIASDLHAAGPARRVVTAYTASAQRSAAAKSNNGLVIVPFAVPVAVPVATVQQPSVLYSFRRYADESLTASTPVTLPQGEREERSAASSLSTAPASSSQLDAAAVLSRHCASCHRGSASQGSLMLFDTAGTLLNRLPRQAVLEAVEQNRMPQPATATRLTAQEIDLLRAWAKPPKDLLY
jgi:mono/diheme cytochrome c family protein